MRSVVPVASSGVVRKMMIGSLLDHGYGTGCFFSLFPLPLTMSMFWPQQYTSGSLYQILERSSWIISQQQQEHEQATNLPISFLRCSFRIGSMEISQYWKENLFLLELAPSIIVAWFDEDVFFCG
jgi:hypothetical protein